MKLARHIERHFNRILFLSIVTSIITVCAYSYFSAKHNFDKSVDFIMAHVKAVAESEINAQNISEIDKAINLVFHTWKDTQGLDLRIKVFLDDRIVGHAGQLSPLSFPAMTFIKTQPTPSSQNLRIEVQASLLDSLVTSLVSLLLIIGFLWFSFRLLRRNVTSTVRQLTAPLESRVEWLKLASTRLQDSIKSGYDMPTSDIAEMNDLDGSLRQLFDQILTYEKDLAKRSFDEGRIRTVDAVAHNLKNAITIFRYRLSKARSLSASDKLLFEDVLDQIQGLSTGILETRKAGVIETFDLIKSVRKVITQKQEVFSDKVSVNLGIQTSEDLPDELLVSGPRAEFEASIANIITNSFEAIEAVGEVLVAIQCENGIAEINIKDNGKGIPAEILPRLMLEGSTFKPEGNGLGLFHARSTVESKMNGHLEIYSTEGVGTTVTLKIPVKTEILKPLLNMDIFPGMNLVFIDDDPLIHSTFREILERFESNITVTSLHSTMDFEKWFAENGEGDLGSRFYFFDYNLKNDRLNGLDLIKKYRLSLESWLVTGDSGRTDIQENAKVAGVKVVSKSDIENIKFNLLETTKFQEVGHG